MRLRIRNAVVLLLAFFLVMRWIPVKVLSASTKNANEPAPHIKWVDFSASAAAMREALAVDIATHKTGEPISWITLLTCYAAKNDGNFKSYKNGALTNLAQQLKAGKTPQQLGCTEKLYRYYMEAYTAILGGMVGEYTLDGEKQYGLCAFSPIARGYSYSHYDDFGASRSYGYERPHLGHDMLGSIGTPIVAVEGGYVEAVGWNQYGGWRVGIRSFDGKRYYYYAHLRRDHPYNDLYEGKIVRPGEVIGYLGMTGYSTKENVNNINVPHLHFGMQLIFAPSQKDGWNQIWIDLYELTEFLSAYRSTTRYDATAKEHYAVHQVIPEYMPD